jgi:hypothetical protein
MDGRLTHLRTARAALFAALCLTLSSTSHVLLSRAQLPLATLAVAGAGIFAAAFWLAGRERGWWQIAALLVPLELTVDFLFTKGQNTCYGPSGGPLTGPWRSMTGRLLCGDGGGTGQGPGVGRAVSGMAHGTFVLPAVSPWLLLAVHVLVGLMAAWWLRQGEAAAFRLVRTLAAYATAPLRLLLAVPEPPAAPSRPRHRRVDGPSPTDEVIRLCVGRRGPPLPLPV